MIQQLLRRVRPADDRGALLIIAIAIITVVALVTGVVLTRGDGSLRATVALRDVARTAYAADAAAQVAINDLRTGYNTGNGEPNPWYYTNVENTGCFGFNGTPPNPTTPINSLVLNNLMPKVSGETQQAMSARVECTADDATGSQGSAVPINNQNKPGYAIVTLNGPLNSSGSLNVHGGIYTNGNINGVVNVDEGEVRAVGSCTQTIAAPKTCNGSVTPIGDPGIGNSAYDPDLTSVPALQKPPTACSSGVAAFEPGYYDSASAMTTATNLNCVAWFKPGTYYFDFHNDSCANVCPSNVFGTGGNTWSINGGTVIGGTRTGGTTMPGSCVSPITDVNAQGVQFVFGGSSRMYIDNNSKVELCGTYHANRPPIVVYGLKTGSTPTATNLTVAGNTALTTSGANPTVSVPTGTVTPATVTTAIVKDPDNTVATWTRDATGPNNVQTGTITMSGYAPTSTIPKGAVLTGAKLVVRHKDGSTTAANASDIVFTPTGSSSTQTVPVPARATLTTDTTVDLSTLTGWGAIQTYVHDNGFTGASMAYRMKLPRSQNAQLDSVQLEMTYYLPVLRGQTGTCAATGTSCPLISMKNGNNKIQFYLQGTTYGPLSYFDILLGNFSSEVAKFGIIARQLDFTETNGNTSWTGPVFEIPDNSPGFGIEKTLVRLSVYVCPGVTCNSGGELALKTKVMIFDEGGTAGPPYREMSVLSWSHTR